MQRKRKITTHFEGQKFGRLTLLERLEKNEKRNSYYFKCMCDCGNECKVLRSDMVNGNTKSCGCLSSRNFAGDITRTHGMRETRQYNIWSMMLARCNKPSNKSYKDYGGKGIRVEWSKFEEFWSDMSSTYSDDLTIDRIDNSKNYCKENCRWVTKAEQARNKTTNVLITFNGETLPVKTMCEKHGLHYRAIAYRIRSGWEVEKALTTPIKEKRKR